MCPEASYFPSHGFLVKYFVIRRKTFMFVSGHVSRGHVSRVTLVVDNKLSRAAAAGAESQSRRLPLKLMTNS